MALEGKAMKNEEFQGVLFLDSHFWHSSAHYLLPIIRYSQLILDSSFFILNSSEGTTHGLHRDA